MGVVRRVTRSGAGRGDKSVKKSKLREIASLGLKAILEDVTGVGEGLQSVDELLESGNPRTVLEEGFDIQHKPRDPQDEKQAMDTSNPWHLQSPTREKTKEAAEEDKVWSLEDLAAASEKQQSDEKIIDDLKRKVEGLSSDNSQLQAELDEMDCEDREENRKAECVMEELAKFATPEQTSLVEANHQVLLAWLQKTLLELQHAQTVTQGQNSYLNRRIRGKDNECLFLGSEFEDFNVESSAEVKDLEAKASKQDEEIYSLRKIKNEWDEMLVGCKAEKEERMEKLRVKVAEGFENFDKCYECMRLLEDKSSQRIRSIEAKMDSHGERFEVLGYVFGRANDGFLEELFACTKELQMEKAKERPPHLEKDSLMIENDKLIAKFLYMDMVVLILERGVLEISEEVRRAARHLCGAIQDFRQQCNRLLRNHEPAP